MIVGKDELVYLVKGAALLGSGGGGAISTGLQFVDVIMEQTQQRGVSMLTPPLSDAIADVGACVVCDIGSITSVEANQAKAIVNAVRLLSDHYEQQSGQFITAVMPIETGPENSLAPFVAAAMLDLVVLDGDGGGRAVPQLSLCSFADASNLLPPCPASVANDQQDWLLIKTPDATGLDVLLRPITAAGQFGNSASMALWAGKAGPLMKASVAGNLTLAIKVGQLLTGIQNQNQALISDALASVNGLQGRLLGEGIVLSVTQSETGAFTYGKTIIEDKAQKATITVLSQNENLIAYSTHSSTPIACAPDSITYLRTDFSPLTNSEIKTGDKVFLLEIAANQQLQKPTIRQGFDQLLTQLGFWGSTQLMPNTQYELGNLLTHISLHKYNTTS